MSYSKVIMLGNLVRRPEAKGKLVVGTIAVNRSFKKGDKWEKEVAFVDFKGTGIEAMLDCNKGQLVLMEGNIVQENWESKDGTQRSKLAVWCQTWRYGGEKPKKDPEDTMSNLDETPF